MYSSSKGPAVQDEQQNTDSLTLKMEAVRISKTSGTTHPTIWRYTPECASPLAKCLFLLGVFKRKYTENLHHKHVHPTVCITTGPYPVPKPVLHRMQSSAPSFNFQQLLLSLWPYSNCLSLLPCLSVTYILLFIFPSMASLVV